MYLQPLFDDIDERLKLGERIIVAIDGMAAAGKSTLAARLNERFSCNALHTDHFFLRPEQRVPERLASPGGNIDFERFAAEVIEPLKLGESFSYRPYDCARQALSEPIAITPTQLTVVEGVYSMRPEFADIYDIRVFMKLSEALQRQRLRERSPELYERFISEWIPMENRYFKHFGVEAKCDYVFECML